MRIAFFDAISWDYVIESAWESPLGGTQSGLCYLASNLAEQGHEVWLLNHCSRPQVSRGVNCAPLDRILQGHTLRNLRFDAVVVIGSARNGRVVKSLVGESTKVILWSGHASDQPCVEGLRSSELSGSFDAFALVSSWQQESYVRDLGVGHGKTRVLRNAIAPAFEARLGATQARLRDIPEIPAVLAFTSTPFRGLALLVAAFPGVRAQFPALELKVFSSMKIYRMDSDEEDAEFGELYSTCRSLEGVQYVGALPQPELAESLDEVSILAYPNVYPETSCISVMEAMASGCQIVTSRLGALAETTAGFARLAETQQGQEAFTDDFNGHLVSAILDLGSSSHRDRMQRQVRYVAENYTWGPRAREWSGWIESLQRRAEAA